MGTRGAASKFATGALWLAVVAVATCCGTATDKQSRTSFSPVLAYATTAGVFLSDGSGVARQVAPLTGGAAAAHLTWSPDGRFLAWQRYGDSSGARLEVLDVQKMQPTILPADISSGPARVGSQFVALDSSGHLLVVTLASGGKVAARTADLQLGSQTASPITDAELIGAAPTAAVVAVPTAQATPYGGPSTIYLVGLDGKSTGYASEEQLSHGSELDNIRPGWGATASSTGQFIFRSGTRATGCTSESHLETLSTGAVGLSSGPALPRISPPSAHWRVLSVYQDLDGALHMSAVAEPASCGSTDLQPNVWSWTSGEWRLVQSGAIWSSQSADRSQTATLLGQIADDHGSIAFGAPATLVVVSRGGQTKTLSTTATEAEWRPHSTQ